MFFLFASFAILSGCVATPVNYPINSTITPGIPSDDGLAIEEPASKIAFTATEDDNNVLYIMNLDGSDMHKIGENIPGLINIFEPAWSPIGDYIAFSGLQENGTGQIFIVKPDDSSWRQLTDDPGGAMMPAWSPDGQYIIYLTERDGVLSVNRKNPVGEIYIMKVDGSEQRRITNNQDFERSFQWSPQNNLLVISANVYEPPGYDAERIYLMGLDGIIQQQLTTVGYNSDPKWSPDGSLILFTSSRDDRSGIYLMNSDGSNQTCLIEDVPAHDGKDAILNITPSWAEDGRSILFSSNRDGDWDVYTIRPDGTHLTQITNLPGNEYSPVWVR